MKGWIIDKTYYKNEDEDQKLKMGGGSWTINLQEVPNGIENIEYRTPKQIYKITWNEANEKGFVKTFRGEPKLIVPVRHWTIKQ